MSVIAVTAEENKEQRRQEDAFIIEDNTIDSNISIDNVIIDSARKEMIINSISNFISFFSNSDNNKLFRDVYGYGNGLTLLFTGTSGCGKTMLAHALANYFNKKIMMIGINPYLDYNYCHIDKDIRSQSDDLVKCLSEVNKLNAIALIDEADKTDSRLSNIGNILNMIEHFEGILIITTNNTSWCNGSLMRRINHIFKFDIPTQEDQLQIWKVNIPDAYKDWFSEVDFDYLSNKFNFTGGLIKNIVQSAIRDSYGNKSDKISTSSIVKISNILSRQIFNQYYSTSDRMDHFFSADTNIHIQNRNPMIAINTKYYKDAYDKIDRIVSSYDTYRKIKGIAMFSDGNSYDNTINRKGRITFINSTDITYTLQVMLEVLRNRNESARIINQEIMFENTLLSHPLYKNDTTFIKAIGDPMLGINCPMIIVDNIVNDIINKAISDLTIIQKKNSKRCIYLGYSSGNGGDERDINDTDKDNYTNTLSAIGDLILNLLGKDYSDTYFLVNTSNNNLENICKSIEGIYYVDLRKIVNKDAKKLLSDMIDMLNDSHIEYDSKRIDSIMSTDILNKMNPMSLSILIKDAYSRAIVNCKKDKCDLNNKFYDVLKEKYTQSYNSDNFPMFN